jgi:glycine cleavage system pyridoxal-binding protein P
MVAAVGFPSLDALIDATVPASIRRKDGMDLGDFTDGMTEAAFLEKFKCVAVLGLGVVRGMGGFVEGPGWWCGPSRE